MNVWGQHRIEDEGMRAGHFGVPISACPHPVNSEEWKAWNRGYAVGQRDSPQQIRIGEAHAEPRLQALKAHWPVRDTSADEIMAEVEDLEEVSLTEEEYAAAIALRDHEALRAGLVDRIMEGLDVVPEMLGFSGSIQGRGYDFVIIDDVPDSPIDRVHYAWIPASDVINDLRDPK